MEFSYARIAQRNLARSKKRTDSTVGLENQSILVREADIWNENGFTKGSILIENGRIKRIARRIIDNGVERINASGLKALPGLIDVHVHLRDMELSYKEDFTTGTSAAAVGGFTSLLDMPNSQPIVDSADRLRERMHVASRGIVVNVGFHVAAVVRPDRLNAMARLGAFSLKLYMPRPI